HPLGPRAIDVGPLEALVPAPELHGLALDAREAVLQRAVPEGLEGPLRFLEREERFAPVLAHELEPRRGPAAPVRQRLAYAARVTEARDHRLRDADDPGDGLGVVPRLERVRQRAHEVALLRGLVEVLGEADLQRDLAERSHERLGPRQVVDGIRAGD